MRQGWGPLKAAVLAKKHQGFETKTNLLERTKENNLLLEGRLALQTNRSVYAQTANRKTDVVFKPEIELDQLVAFLLVFFGGL